MNKYIIEELNKIDNDYQTNYGIITFNEDDVISKMVEENKIRNIKFKVKGYNYLLIIEIKKSINGYNCLLSHIENNDIQHNMLYHLKDLTIKEVIEYSPIPTKEELEEALDHFSKENYILSVIKNNSDLVKEIISNDSVLSDDLLNTLENNKRNKPCSNLKSRFFDDDKDNIDLNEIKNDISELKSLLMFTGNIEKTESEEVTEYQYACHGAYIPLDIIDKTKPFYVKNNDNSIIYKEGIDYKKGEASIFITYDSKIEDGEEIAITYTKMASKIIYY